MWMQEERVENFRKTGIDRKAFNMILEHIREACDALQIDSRARDMLLEDLICIEDLIYGVRDMVNSEGSIGEMFDERQAFETRLIKEFYTALDRNVELRYHDAHAQAHTAARVRFNAFVFRHAGILTPPPGGRYVPCTWSGSR